MIREPTEADTLAPFGGGRLVLPKERLGQQYHKVSSSRVKFGRTMLFCERFKKRDIRSKTINDLQITHVRPPSTLSHIPLPLCLPNKS
jgi:hypothetical protein